MTAQSGPGRAQVAGFTAGLDQPLFLIAGTCVVESRESALETAGLLAETGRELGFPLVYKSSFDKANRSSLASFRGHAPDRRARAHRRA